MFSGTHDIVDCVGLLCKVWVYPCAGALSAIILQIVELFVYKEGCLSFLVSYSKLCFMFVEQYWLITYFIFSYREL
jgi:hypothetical protein